VPPVGEGVAAVGLLLSGRSSASRMSNRTRWTPWWSFFTYPMTGLTDPSVQTNALDVPRVATVTFWASDRVQSLLDTAHGVAKLASLLANGAGHHGDGRASRERSHGH